MSHGDHTTAAPEVDVCAHLDLGHAMTSMTFHMGYCENVMFDWWKIRDVGTLVASMLGIFLMAMIYESIKYYREYLWMKNRTNSHSDKKMLENTSRMNKYRTSVLSSAHVLQTALHVVQLALSYLLMLIFMTFNGWLCIAVIAGAAAGFFLFGWNKAEEVVDITEHCH